MIEIKYLKAFKDNYIWLIKNNDDVIVIDPGESAQVVDYITINNLKLNCILLTHSHPDHIGGVANLLDYFGNVPIYGANCYATISVSDLDIIEILPEVSIKVLATPGHTMDGVSFLLNDKHLFCGDTLFAGGCGRVFTGDYNLMYTSIVKIKNLYKSNNNVLIYPAHEYTLSNLRFGITIEPNNIDIINRIKQVEDIRSNNGITLPTNLELELKTNPFLRCNLKQNVYKSDYLNELEEFTQIRKRKDIF
ncbi:MAG: hydroxyacylglutathione hydrolase [Neisseriaceae bacterium]